MTKDDSDSDESDNEGPDKKQNKYSANTLRNFCYALNPILRSKGHLFNITEKGTSFMKSNDTFKVAIKDLKKEGKAEFKSYPEISKEDSKHLNFHLDPPETKCFSCCNCGETTHVRKVQITKLALPVCHKLLPNTFNTKFSYFQTILSQISLYLKRAKPRP